MVATMAVKKVECLVEQRVDMMVGSMVGHSVEWKVVTSAALMVDMWVDRSVAQLGHWTVV